MKSSAVGRYSNVTDVCYELSKIQVYRHRQKDTHTYRHAQARARTHARAHTFTHSHAQERTVERFHTDSTPYFLLPPLCQRLPPPTTPPPPTLPVHPVNTGKPQRCGQASGPCFSFAGFSDSSRRRWTLEPSSKYLSKYGSPPSLFSWVSVDTLVTKLQKRDLDLLLARCYWKYWRRRERGRGVAVGSEVRTSKQLD